MTGATNVSETPIAQTARTNRVEQNHIGRISFMIFCSLVFCILMITPACGQTSNEKSGVAHLVGDWTGESICANKEKFPGCNDEHVVYHVAVTPNKADSVTIKMDKIIDGKPNSMGEGEFVYDPKKQTLVSEYKNSRVHLTIEFMVKGDVIEGIVASMPERTIVRNVKIKKDK